jgi:SAM-dependent methyltransferase
MQHGPPHRQESLQAPSPACPALPPGFEIVLRCDLCGGDRFEYRGQLDEQRQFTGEQFDLMACADCGLAFINPRPTRELIGFYYDADYELAGPRTIEVATWQRMAGEPRRGRRSSFERLYLHLRQSLAAEMIPPFEDGGSVLELGCGDGALLDVLRDLGWETHGVECNPMAAARAIAGGHKVICGPADGAHHDAHRFDLVYLWHLLEHTHEPSEVLAQANRCLKPGGRLYLAVPNAGGLQARILGPAWDGANAPRHLYHFDARTITEYLRRSGFEDIRITTRSGRGGWWRGLRHSLNRAVGSRMAGRARCVGAACTPVAAAASLVRFLGAGSELRLVCRKQQASRGRVLPLRRVRRADEPAAHAEPTPFDAA